MGTEIWLTIDDDESNEEFMLDPEDAHTARQEYLSLQEEEDEEDEDKQDGSAAPKKKPAAKKQTVRIATLHIALSTSLSGGALSPDDVLVTTTFDPSKAISLFNQQDFASGRAFAGAVVDKFEEPLYTTKAGKVFKVEQVCVVTQEQPRKGKGEAKAPVYKFAKATQRDMLLCELQKTKGSIGLLGTFHSPRLAAVVDATPPDALFSSIEVPYRLPPRPPPAGHMGRDVPPPPRGRSGGASSSAAADSPSEWGYEDAGSSGEQSDRRRSGPPKPPPKPPPAPPPAARGSFKTAKVDAADPEYQRLQSEAILRMVQLPDAIQDGYRALNNRARAVEQGSDADPEDIGRGQANLFFRMDMLHANMRDLDTERKCRRLYAGWAHGHAPQTSGWDKPPKLNGVITWSCAKATPKPKTYAFYFESSKKQNNPSSDDDDDDEGGSSSSSSSSSCSESESSSSSSSSSGRYSKKSRKRRRKDKKARKEKKRRKEKRKKRRKEKRRHKEKKPRKGKESHKGKKSRKEKKRGPRVAPPSAPPTSATSASAASASAASAFASAAASSRAGEGPLSPPPPEVRYDSEGQDWCTRPQFHGHYGSEDGEARWLRSVQWDEEEDDDEDEDEDDYGGGVRGSSYGGGVRGSGFGEEEEEEEEL